MIMLGQIYNLLTFTNIIGIASLFSHDNRYLWKHETKGKKWGPCSVTCGTGFQETLLFCYDAINEIPVSKSKCINKHKPVLTKKCELEPCKQSSFDGYWFETEWGECTVTCGRGIQSRLIACINHAGTEILDNSKCPGKKPQDYRECNKLKCIKKASWKTGKWGNCSASCDGKQHRTVTCQFSQGLLAGSKECRKSSKKPSREKSCGPPCQKWIAGEWGRCKYNKRRKPCTMAKESRCVLCVDIRTLKHSNKCSSETRPETKRSCAVEACSQKLFT